MIKTVQKKNVKLKLDIGVPAFTIENYFYFPLPELPEIKKFQVDTNGITDFDLKIDKEKAEVIR